MLRNPSELIKSMRMLERNLLNCYPYDCFGFDNRGKIKTMLEVI